MNYRVIRVNTSSADERPWSMIIISTPESNGTSFVVVVVVVVVLAASIRCCPFSSALTSAELGVGVVAGSVVVGAVVVPGSWSANPTGNTLVHQAVSMGCHKTCGTP